MQGTKALAAKIDALQERRNLRLFVPEIKELECKIYEVRHDEKLAALKNRKNDDPFIPNLRSLEEKIHTLEKLKADPCCFQVLSGKVIAAVPDKPVGPRRLFILIGGLFLGLFIGTLSVIFRSYILNRQN
jgi:chain length determinant protein (polysaccharide antigen chain regulator)